ncbi:hypothetical protein [Microbacterium sp.]|uniref:hypothetical protein n=1 Tax=Microbacterium sp. TaxID=51671 RepID=UPI00092829E6|nr:hypothetical protein [Microbacterium sp.]MBN9193855.1 hypothetical protein [Microbacterium sp.]OJU70081.1 MAG: hypothetical protein BGO04_05170 [Microbacterium sp. 70-38]
MNMPRIAATTVILVIAGAMMSGCAAGATSAPTRVPVPDVASTGESAIACVELHDALPGWSVDPTLSPGPGTPSEAAVRAGGTGCVLTKGDTHLLIGVAHPDETSASALQDYFRSNGLISEKALGDTAYFDPSTGDAEIFDHGRWITVVSDSFASPADAEAVIAAIEGVVSAHD